MSSTTDKPLHGVVPVLQTPFTMDRQIDAVALRREIDWAFHVGAHGVATGMVSEITRLCKRGRRELTALVCEAVGDRGYRVISVGAEYMADAIDYAQQAEELGASAVMAIPPVGTLAGREATCDYFAKICNSVSIPLVVQDASSYVGSPIDVSVYLSLLDRFGPERIYFKPEANPLGSNLSRLRDATNGRARIFEGSGGINLVDCYRRGIVGTMPGMDLLDGVAALWESLEAGDDERAYQLSLPICGIVALQLQAGLDGFLAIEKHLLQAQGIFENTLRLPPVGWELDRETRAEVDRLFTRLKVALQGGCEAAGRGGAETWRELAASGSSRWSDGIIG